MNLSTIQRGTGTAVLGFLLLVGAERLQAGCHHRHGGCAGCGWHHGSSGCAGCGWHHGQGGCAGCDGSYYGGDGYAYGDSGYPWGAGYNGYYPYDGWSWAARHAAWDPTGYHPYYGQYSYNNGGYGIWGSWYAENGIFGVPPVSLAIRAYGPSRYYPSYYMPQAQPAVESVEDIAPPPASAEAQPNPGRAILSLEVAEDARVYVNGTRMATPGTSRQFQTPNLKPNDVCIYDVRAEVRRNGRLIVDTQRVELRAGETRSLVFNLDESRPVATGLAGYTP
jgi:uncharacterized protein (TIGR03000 family)